MNFLLRLKSWQLLILIFLPSVIPPLNFSCRIVNVSGFLIYISWIYTIGTVLHSMLPIHLKPKVIFFKISCVICLLFVIIGSFSNLLDFNPFEGNNIYIFCILFAIVMIVMFYTFSFAARMLESKIKGKIVNRSDSLRTFVYIWFFPIGIWYIQPMIKQALNDDNN